MSSIFFPLLSSYHMDPFTCAHLFSSRFLPTIRPIPTQGCLLLFGWLVLFYSGSLVTNYNQAFGCGVKGMAFSLIPNRMCICIGSLISMVFTVHVILHSGPLIPSSQFPVTLNLQYARLSLVHSLKLSQHFPVNQIPNAHPQSLDSIMAPLPVPMFC